MGAGKSRTGARGGAADAAQRALVGFKAGDVHFEQGARGNVQFEAPAAAVDERAGGNSQAALLFDHADRFACRAARGPNVLDYQDAFARVQFKTSAQSHEAGTVAFHKQRTHAQPAGYFVTNNDATQRGGYHAGDGEIAEAVGKGAAQLFRVHGMRQDERALDIRSAMAAARKLEVALADRANAFEELENVFAFHVPPETRDLPPARWRR